MKNILLANQAKVYLIPLLDAKSATVLIMLPVGSRYEPEKLSGVSHFIEHMMFKGTKKRPSTLILTREIDRLGAHYNAFTGKEYTGFFIKADSQYLPTSLDILSDMLFNSKFDKDEIKREKTVITEEIRMYRDNPMINIENVFENLLYAPPLGRDVAGSEKTVRDLQRDEILEFKDAHYSPDNMMVVIAGKIDNSVERMIEKYFDRVKPASLADHAASQNNFKAVRFGEIKKEKRVKVEKKETDQTQLMIGFPGFPYEHKQNTALNVLDTILGGSMSSRLFIEIRERRGLAYLVRSGEENYRDSGYFFVRAGLESKNINEAIKVTISEINKIKNKGVSAKELKDAKTHIRGALALSLEDSSAQASWYANQAMFFKKIKTPEEKLKEIDKITNEEIKNVAQSIFKFDEMRIAIIGNADAKNIRF